ncbi:MAG: PepSY domain-containing protein [Bacteroidales bacterium]|nr:PepSY domain-containing protein [Bacteroidales bacterium]
MSWRVWHKWAGILLAIPIMIFCFSGVVLNHRQALSRFAVSRSWLPDAYQIEHWNQGVVRGSLWLSDSVQLLYGQVGMWQTDSAMSYATDYNAGVTPGIDNRKISHVVRTADGQLWASGLYDVWRRDTVSDAWQAVQLPGNEERISDIALRGGDTLVVATRSTLYTAHGPEYTFQERPLPCPEGYTPHTTLFKTVWMLHSGELFGLPGRLVVDMLGIVLFILCVTGIIFFVLRYTIRGARNAKQQAGWMKWQLKWHKRLGTWLIVLTVLLAVTGMCLRPPLMIPLVMTDVKPLPGSTLDDPNALHDKLRGIRWDELRQQWLLSTSEGFYWLDTTLCQSAPQPARPAPGVSPMGITVFEPDGDEWLIGSMSGLYRWQPDSARILDFYTGQPYRRPTGRPVGTHAVMGYLPATPQRDAVAFEYSAAPNVAMPDMPTELQSQPMSLWNFALELHVGRCYEPFLGSVVSVLFVFISGLLLALILISGYIIVKRRTSFHK